MKSLKPKVEFSSHENILYKEAWELQTKLHTELKQNKLDWRKLSNDERLNKRQVHKLLFCEHNPVYTLGKSGKAEHLLFNNQELAKESIEYFEINRGGDITFHGPGQLTGYPILDLDEFFTDVHKYVRLLEECIIKLLASYSIVAERVEGFTGVWLPPSASSSKKRKICAIGVHLSRWVTMHGFALNVSTNLEYFNHIIPCGIVDGDKEVTSLEKELGKKVSMKEVSGRLKAIFADVFQFEYV